MRKTLVILLLCVCSLASWAQKREHINPEDRKVMMDSPTYVPMVKVGKALVDGDSIQYMEMNNVYVYPQPTFKDEKQRQQYNRLVYNVKKVLPIAKECHDIIIETYEYLQTLPDKKARDEHLKLVEEDIKRTYTPRMKKLTYSQGKLLIKLVDRECNSTSYGLIQAILGPVKAGFYQAFAWLYGASLKKQYDPKGKDRLTERVVRMVESGQL
ncbi:MAG: DUF4294 domain-containing protein [Prevotella sp.]|jgi:hypothetical protein|nr:DUF4294 domain-containing protein [Prevotella sp.]